MDSHMAVNWPMSSSVARRTRYLGELTPPILGVGPEKSKSKSHACPHRYRGFPFSTQARLPRGGDESSGPTGQFRPVRFLEDFGGDQRRANSQGGAPGFQEVGDVVHVHPARRHDAKVGQWSAQGLDVACSKTVRGEDLDEVSAGLVGYLRFGGCLNAEHNRAVGG